MKVLPERTYLLLFSGSRKPDHQWSCLWKPIRGHVAFLGGPLHFLSELKEAFIRTLKLDDEHIIAPENSHLFAAIGSALNYKEDVTYDLSDILDKLSSDIKMEFEVARMEPLLQPRLTMTPLLPVITDTM